MNSTRRDIQKDVERRKQRGVSDRNAYTHTRDSKCVHVSLSVWVYIFVCVSALQQDNEQQDDCNK